MQIKIREAVFEDISGILQLYKQTSMDHGRILTIEQAQSIFNKMKTYPNYQAYVAEVNGEIVGTFTLAIMDNLGNIGLPSGIIEDVVVLETLQNKGIGKKMMAYAVSLCRDNGCYKVMLSSNLNRNDAHKFYESFGFKKHGYSFLIEI